MTLTSVIRPVFLTLALIVLCAPARSETLVGKNVDSRVLVGLKVDPETVQGFLPDGWAPVEFPDGPPKGANVLFALIDSLLEMDAEGQPLDPPTRRAAGLVALGKQGEVVRMYVLRLWTTVPERNPYGVAKPAQIERTTTTGATAENPKSRYDAWRIKPDDGGEITFTLDYVTGPRAWAPGEIYPHSASTPEFSRIYRYNQLADLVLSTGLGKAASGTFNLTSTDTEIDAMLGDPLEIVTVIDLPVYVRDVFLP